jgi:hypothetical protein
VAEQYGHKKCERRLAALEKAHPPPLVVEASKQDVERATMGRKTDMGAFSEPYDNGPPNKMPGFARP